MKIKTGKMLVFSLCLCLFTMFLCTYIYATTGKVTEETVRLREKASTDSDTVLLIAEDAEVEILEEDGEWYKVEYIEETTTYTGYIRKDMLDVEDVSEETEETLTEEETENTDETSDSQEETQNDAETVEETSSEETASEEETQVEEVEEETSQIEEQTEVILLDDIKVRILPLINTSTIGTIKADTEIFVTEIIGNWAYIESDSKSGWVLTNKLETGIEEKTNEEESKTEEEISESEEETESTDTEETEEEATETKELYVNATTVNLREKANSSSGILKQLAINTKVTLVEEVDDTWSKVTVSGITGYIATEYLSETETEETTTSRGSDETRTSSSSNDDDEEETTTETSSSESSSSESTNSSSSVTGSDIVAYAKTLLGCRYVYGGTSPSGFDCSGFTQYVYSHFGYTIGRTSSSQRSDGTYVSKSNLQAGDLVCFSGHVGIYVGGNRFIHAENVANGVTISSLSETYYSNAYITARRIIN